LAVRAISLFTGAGGLDVGCESAGFKTVSAVESNERATETLLANRPRWFGGLRPHAIFREIVGLDPHRLLASAGLSPGDADLFHGGPPCTPFSKSGYWLESKRAGADPKSSLLDSYLGLLVAAQPKAFLMENVYGLAYRNQNRAVFERFIAGIRRAGYSFDHRILLAADYGVPQLRQRLFCVGIRSDLLESDPSKWRFHWPIPTHSGPHEARSRWDDSLAPHPTAGEALRDLPDGDPEPEEIVAGTYAEELRAIPAGDNYLWWTARRGHPQPRFRWRSRYWNFLLKLHPERPSPTIQGQPGSWVGPFHWESRRLRVAELKRLMTFPDSYVVTGSRREQQLQLGNAVPPLLAKTVATAIATELRRTAI